MNVLYLASEPRIDTAAAAGHATHILKTIKGLESKGHSVHSIIAGEGPSEKAAKRKFRALKANLPLPISITLRDIYALIHDRQCYIHCYENSRGKKFDFIYERATAYHRTGHRLSKTLGIPHILEVNSPLEELVTFHGCARALIPLASNIERSTASSADAVVVGSAGMRRYLVDRGVRPSRIFTIYPTADDHFFAPPMHRKTIRQQFGLEGKVVVGFVGSMAPYHRVDLLLQAAVEIRRLTTAVQFFIVGDGVGMSELKRFVTDTGLENTITFTGKVRYEDVPEYCGAMDMCIIPYATWYGAPTKLFEYAASGNPVIAPRVEPIQELIRDGENGLLTELGDVETLTDNILTLANNPELRARLGAELKRQIFDNHTWENNTEKLIEIVATIKRNGQMPT